MKLTHLMSAVALTWLISTVASTAFGQSHPRYIGYQGYTQDIKAARA